jgi:RHS repeat-associated protein
MTLPGQMNVSASGAFTYAIPIAVPPGTAGMVPALSLNYSSQSGDGLEGLGWGLSGLPSITRCPRTVAQDNTHGGVNFGIDGNGKDRFCLDGQRLVLVNGGSGHTYGDNGAEYRTEIDGFSKIISNGTSGSGPDNFKVWTKSGQIMEFGNSPDSKAPMVAIAGVIPNNAATPPAGTVRLWAVSKITDTKGNYLRVIYNGGGGSNCVDADRTQFGELCPTQINYTANDLALPQPLTAYNSVQFVYDGRNDITPTYKAGSLLETTKILRHIKICISTQNPCPSGSVISDYTLDYNYAAANTAQHDQLKSVTLCDGAGNCLPATTFGWQGSRDKLILADGANGYANSQFQGTEGGWGTGFLPGDFNGDGLLDVVPYAIPNACAAYVGSQSGKSFSTGPTASWSTGSYGGSGGNQYIPETGTYCEFGDNVLPAYAMMDVDGDGFTDFSVQGLVADHSIMRQIVWNNRAGALVQIPQTPQYFLSGDHEFADFDGDGRTDYFEGTTVYYSKGDGTFTQGSSYSGLGAKTLIPSDFDGDGCADILAAGMQYHIVQYLCNPAVSQVQVPDWLNDDYTLTLGDFNGDGETDVLRTGNGVPAKLYLSTGTGFVQVWADANGHSWEKWAIVAGDFNGDGKTDVVLVADDCTCVVDHFSIDKPHELWLSTGSGFVQATDQNGAPLTLPNGNSSDVAYLGLPRIVARSADWNNDGASDIWLQKKSGDVEFLFAYQPELVNLINNGVGGTTNIVYDRLNRNASFYAKGTDANGCTGSAPTSCTQNVDGPLYVVSEIDSSNGLGPCTLSTHDNCYWSSYAYAGAKMDLRGRGFLGFSQVTVTDQKTHVVQTTNYLSAFPYTGLVASQTKVCPTGICLTTGPVTLSSTTNCYNTDPTCQNVPPSGGTAPYTVELMKTTQASRDTDNTPLPTVTTSYMNPDGTSAYDAYGNALLITQTVTDGTNTATKITANTFTYDVTNWLIGRLTQAAVQNTAPGKPTLTRTSSFDYYMADYSGLLHDETVEPGDSSSTLCLYLNTAYDYDQFGNRQAATSQAYSSTCGATRTTHTTYAYDGMSNYGEFATTITNAMGQSETWDYVTGSNSGRGFGVPLSHTGPNGLTTHWVYDGFGRKTLETRPDNTKTAVSYTYCTSLPTGESCPNNAVFDIIVVPQNSAGTQNGAKSVAYYDSLGRVLASDVQGFDGGWIRTATEYDALGRALRTSRPYFLAANNPVWTTTSYNAASGLNDPLGRPQTVATPDGGFTVYTYAGLTTTVAVHPRRRTDQTFEATESTITARNVQGLVHTVQDALTHTTTYDYDSEGDLIGVTDHSGNATVNSFDLRGRKLTALDPDMGKPGSHAWTYGYDAFGDLVSQTDAKGQTTTLAYDVLGRVRHRVEPTSSGSFISNWIYNDTTVNTNHDVGQLIQACTRTSAGTDCTGLVSADYLRSLTYDTTGRPLTVVLTVGGTAYTYTANYNSDGRINYIKRPSALRVDYGYVTTFGYLKTLTDHATGTVYWTANTRDPEMHLTQWTAGNGMVTSQGFDPNTGLVLNIHAGPSDSVANFAYNWDSIGNLLVRSDMLAGAGGGVTENFCYDVLNRATNYALGATCTATGGKTVAYDGLGNITTKSDVSTSGGYQYGGSTNAGPHALTSITSCTSSCMLVNGVTSPSFTYDANGNMTCELPTGQSNCTSAAPRYVTWTAFNMVDKIVQSGPVPGGLQFVYDSEHARIKMCVPACSGIPATTTYLNTMGQLEEKYVASGVTTWRDYIQADGKLVAERSKTGTVVTLSYFVTDHLGSVSVVTDSTPCTLTCTVIERDAYDAWGRRRNASDWSDNPSCAIASTTTRGFTGHEELDSVCLVNANARIYDPTVGRFMSPDDMVPDPLDLQSLNRYSYVDNNPLSFTDPTGHEIGIETVVVWGTQQFAETVAPQAAAAAFLPPQVTAALVAADIILTLIGAGDILGLGDAATVAAPPAISVAAPHAAVSSTAGGNPAGVSSNPNSPVQPQEIAHPTPVSSTSAEAQTPQLAQAEGIDSSTTSSRGIITAKQQEGWCEGQCSMTSDDAGNLHWGRSQGFTDDSGVESVVNTVDRHNIYSWFDTFGGQVSEGFFRAAVDAMAVAGSLPFEGAALGIRGLQAARTFAAARNTIGWTGQIGENALKQLGGRSQVFFPTSQGARIVDQLANGVANEAKVGYQSLNAVNRLQLSKDAELLDMNRVDSVTWHFYESPVTGKIGPSQPLLDALDQNDIDVVIH